MVFVLSVGMTGCRSDDEEKEVNEVKANDISLSFTLWGRYEKVDCFVNI